MMEFEHFYNKHYGKTGLIICNGPSLRDVPIEFLNKYPNFGLNNIWLLKNFTPKYFVATNPVAIEGSLEEIKQIKATKFVRDDFDIPDSNKLCIIPHPSGFSLDLTWGVHEGHTVTHVAMQIAYYMGFKTILVVGLDHRFTYEGPEDTITTTEGDDVNHFDPNYFKGKSWYTPNLRESEISFEIDRMYYESADRRIINLTPNTALDIFEKDSIANW